MAVQINYKISSSKKVSSNVVLFVDEKFNISQLKKRAKGKKVGFVHVIEALRAGDKVFYLLRSFPHIEYWSLIIKGK